MSWWADSSSGTRALEWASSPQHPPLHLGERRGAGGQGGENISSSNTSSQTCTSFLSLKARDHGERWTDMSPAMRSDLRRENRVQGEEVQHILPPSTPKKKKRQFGVSITPKMVPLRPEKKTKMSSLGKGYWETQSSSTLEAPLSSSSWQWLR